MPVIQVKKQHIFNMAESNCVKTMELEMDIFFLGGGHYSAYHSPPSVPQRFMFIPDVKYITSSQVP